MELDLRNATLCVSGAKPIIQTLQISPALKNGLHIGSHGRAVCKIEGDEKIEVKADFDMLKNVFANLARSSLERCKMGDIWIEAHISVEDKKVKITYSDNGSGIPKEKQEKLFSPFDKDAMSEMGLPVVALVLKELAGSIRLDQNYSGDGTKFIIELPVP
jgi:signal transduction histidine kinase